MFKHILLPTDGAELSAAAIQQGIRFAKSIGAKVTGLNVMPLQHTVFYHKKISKEALEEVAQRFKEQAETYWRRLKKEPRKRELRVTSFMKGTILPTNPSSGWLSRKVVTLS